MATGEAQGGLVQRTFDVSARRVLITGASSGFGEHFARMFAEAGVRTLALLARRTQRLEALASELRDKYPGIVVAPVACDVSRVPDIARAVAEAERLAGDKVFDVVVNNAGLGPAVRFFNEAEETYNRVMDVNLRGAFFVAQETARRMVAARVEDGSIINISSIFGMRVGYAHSVYSMSKAALTHMSKALALELAREGVRVNTISPGYFRTELTAEYYDSPKGDAFLRKHMPLQRLGLLEELDGAMLLLASHASRFMFGTNLAVDGAHVISSL